MSRAVDAARSALLEARRPDLAGRVYGSRRGWPNLQGGIDPLTSDDESLVVRAFLIGHQAGGHIDVREGPDSYGQLSLYCPLCSEGVTEDAL